ncbi:MAG: DUF3662 and FHA domain-containing protein [Solirubrobacteraceae bacterium]
MTVLKSIESRIAGLVEGTFSRAFKSEVRPVEIARKLAREMEEHKSYSVSRTYAPNEYRVYLSPRDRERFVEEEGYLVSELAGYLLEHARRENLALRSRPVVQFITDERLGLGEFGIQTRTSAAPSGDSQQEGGSRAPGPPVPPSPRGPSRPPDQDAGGRTMIYSTAERMAEQLQEPARFEQRSALLLMDGKRLVIGAGGATMGRSRQCEVMVDDPNVSRQHAEIRPRGGSWVVTDLGSTNGSRLNGRRLEQPTVLKPGDEIELGTTTLTFALE